VHITDGASSQSLEHSLQSGLHSSPASPAAGGDTDR
jgi:hypothetical protein